MMSDSPRLAMVLAAGYGKRLRPLTDSLPKPLVVLAGKPLLEHALDAMASWGVEHVFVNSHHIGGKLAEWHEGYARRSFVSLVEEPVLLGTGGGIRNALLGHLVDDESALISNGDVLYRPDVRQYFRRHRENRFFASMLIRDAPNRERYGLIGADESGRMTRLLSAGDSEAPLLGMFSGVHFLSKQAIASLPEVGCVVRKGYQPWFEQGRELGAFLDDAPWHDAGEYPLFRELERKLAAGEIRWP